ncbi:hypothetical protein F53441_11361 [Fusarium austroafricanum]|uniref:Uncharacterized protein n=1 Tax=Fusarium austroafricanum TaxID=2364996 RepID=A0A8H4K6N0_9HYPO|nr:hypothetical protein F53441_11361 [Fusarium austroafricanum]
MDKHLQKAKKLIVQDRLDSLKLRLEELGKSFTNLPTDQLSKHSISCMKDIRSLAYECLNENIDRLDRADNHQRDDDPQCTIERRRGAFMGLKFKLPPTRLCLWPYNAHAIFEDLAFHFKNCVIGELKYRENNPDSCSKAPAMLITYRPIFNSVSYEKESKEAIEFYTSCENDAYQEYLRLPVTCHVASVALSHYADIKFDGLPLPSGLALQRLRRDESTRGWHSTPAIPGSDFTFRKGDVEVLTATRLRLREENWTWGRALKKRVPPAHPLLEQLNLNFDCIIPEEFGVVVAWRHYGNEAWLDRYGHLPNKVSARVSG